jgi:hypothetical protein
MFKFQPSVNMQLTAEVGISLLSGNGCSRYDGLTYQSGSQFTKKKLIIYPLMNIIDAQLTMLQTDTEVLH